MEQETMLKEILNALKLHADHVDKKFEEMDQRFDKRFNEMDQRFDKRFNEMEKKFDNRFIEMEKKFDNRFIEMEKRFDNRFDTLEKKVDGIRIDLTSTQKTTNFLLEKVANHDDKLLELSQQR